MPHLRKLLIALGLTVFSAHLSAAECSAKSPKYSVPLLELYTSEGCSSCPPADQWLSGLEIETDKLVPLAFHVDYWDYIGWKDRFAKASFSERQRKLAALGGAGFVYTPQFTLNGRDFRSWNDARLNQSIHSMSKEPAHADLAITASLQNNGETLVNASAQSTFLEEAKQADIFIAIYENQLKSTVNAGENLGRVLAHDYVVRELLGPYAFDGNGKFKTTITLKPEWKGRNAGAVMFAQHRRNGNVLQSLGLNLALCH